MLRSGTPSRFVKGIKRPFLLLAIIVSLGCLVYIKWIFKAPALPGTPGSSVTVSGKVKDKTYGEDGSLKNFTVGNALCSVGDTEFSKEPEVGSTVAVSGTIKTFRQAMNKGGFDEETYHRVRGEDYRLYVSSVVELKKAKIGLSEKLCKLKQKLAQRIIRYCPLEYGTVKTLILGDKSSLSEERKDLYQRVSLSHFLVISGLHISAAAALLYRFLRALLRRRAPASLLTLSILVLYGLMIGFSVSVLRAVIMYGVRLAADLTNETYDIISAASLAAVITLINNPLFLTDASFLYSYIAAFTIGFFYDSGVVTGLKGIKEKLKDALRFSLVMVFGMFPVTMYFSGTYSLGALALNLFIVPFGPVMLFAAFMAFLFSTLGIAPAAGFFDFIEACLIRLTDRVADLMARGAFLRLSCNPGALLTVVSYGILLLYLYRLKKSSPIMIRVFILTCVMKVLTTVWWWSPGFTMLYVGQGECLVLRTGMRSAVIMDCGSTSDSEVYKYDLLPYLYAVGINRISGIFVSHSDKDHVSGLSELFEDLDTSGLWVDALYVSESAGGNDPKTEALVSKAKENNIKVTTISAGGRVDAGAWQFTCLWPLKGYALNNANEDSVVLMARNGYFTLLLTGDISSRTEERLLEIFGKDILKADILKIPHHGSKNSSSGAFLEAVDPKISFASAGINNRYSHPSRETKERLTELGIPLYCTKDYGETDAEPSFSNHKLFIKSFKKP